MKTLKEKFQDYLKKKSVWGKITDIIFILFIVALFIPNSRMAIVGTVNRVKSMIIEPSIEKDEDIKRLNSEDFNWTIEDLASNKINLQDFQGKVVFLNLWATWCPPCVGEMPEIQDLYDKFKTNNDVAFLMVSNETNKKVKAFIDKRGYTFPVYTTKFQSPDVFFSQSIPTTFLLSKDGAIIIKETGAVNWGGKKMEGVINDLLSK